MNFSKINIKHKITNRNGVSKTLKSILIIILVCVTTNVNAQILKKLGKKAEQAAERALERKVEEKAERETDKAFDSTFNNDRKSKKKKKSSSPFSSSSIQPAGTYSFSHTYKMQIDDGKRKTNLIYYLNDHGDYFGTSIPNESMNMISVMDMNKKTMFMFMDNNGTKNQMSMNLDFEDMATDAVEDTNHSIKATGKTKTILGYLAKEYEVKGNDMYGTIWITEQAGITFSKAFYGEKSKKGIDKSWMHAINGLFLEMSMTDTSKKKPQNIVMKCISLEKTNVSINTSDYKKMM